MFEALGVNSGVMIILLLALEIVLLILVMSMSMRVRRLNARYKSFMKGQNGMSLEKDINKKMTRMDKYASSIGTLDEAIQTVAEIQQNSVHKYGIVKYDAFDDVGGKLSFVLALLDDSDSGFVLNAVHSKDNCFLYIKEIMKGESYIMLSSEEVEALRIAKRFGTDEIPE